MTTLSIYEITMVVGEYIMAIGALIASVCLLSANIISPGMWLCFTAGIAIGSVWENIHAVIGDDCLSLVNAEVRNWIPPWLYPILHAIADGLVMVSGLGLIWILFRYFIDKDSMKTWTRMTSYDPWILLAFLIFALFQELIVELIFNGRFWKYKVSTANPALFKIGDVEYTIWPFIEWIIASVLFWGISSFLLPMQRVL